MLPPGHKILVGKPALGPQNEEGMTLETKKSHFCRSGCEDLSLNSEQDDRQIMLHTCHHTHSIFKMVLTIPNDVSGCVFLLLLDYRYQRSVSLLCSVLCSH